MKTAALPSNPIPVPAPSTSLRALQAIIRERSVLAGMQIFHQETGDIFRLPLPGFNPVMLVGPEACHYVLVKAREQLRWRMEGDPITKLLVHGLLVEDGQFHDQLRRDLNPALHKQMLSGYIDAMVRRTDQITADWTDSQPVDMLVEMRKIALLILMETLFSVDYTVEVTRLWDSIVRLMKYISPGLWLIWRDAPRPGYARARAEMDHYWFEVIRQRREAGAAGNDMLSLLIAGGMSDDLIRDQLMTMLTAGHDTSTAMLSWAMVLLGNHPEIQAKAQAEIEAVLGDADPTPETVMQLPYLEQIINETLRLYPPAHLGSRTATADLEFNGYHIPAGTRVLYSIYLTHRHPAYWDQPNDFMPERFAPENKGDRPHYAYLPFGGGPRICIGMAFAQVEMKVVLARILQRYTLGKPLKPIHMHMGAALEPHPGVWIQPKQRS